jgi:hypothetical protein
MNDALCAIVHLLTNPGQPGFCPSIQRRKASFLTASVLAYAESHPALAMNVMIANHIIHDAPHKVGNPV